MARSKYIYVIKTTSIGGFGGGILVAAFTVKKEMIQWIKNNLPVGDGTREVWKLKDNPWLGLQKELPQRLGTIEEVIKGENK